MSDNYPAGVKDADFIMESVEERVDEHELRLFKAYAKTTIHDLARLLELADRAGALTDLQRGAIAIGLAALQEWDNVPVETILALLKADK